ncbi:hypothetical protein Tco_1086378, partial [Tanacetum coccineum]
MHNQTVDELPQTLPSFDPICYSGDGSLFTYDSTPNFVDDSPNVFNPPPQPPQFTVNHPIFNAQNEFLNSQNEIMEQMTSICDMVGIYMQKKEEDKRIGRFPFATMRTMTRKEPVDSLIMEDEHLDTIPATESNEVIKFSIENLVPIPSESEGIPDKMCDVPFHDNSLSLDISKDQFEGFSNSNDDSTSIDDNSFSIDDIDYVDASPPDSELVSLEEVKDFHTEDREIKDDILCEKLSKINLLIAKIEAINSNPP